MPAPILSKDEVLKRLFELIRESGYDKATMARITDVTGLGKGSLFHYFPGGKEEIGETMLGLVSDWLESNIYTLLRSDMNDKKKLEKMRDLVLQFYSNGNQGCILGALSQGESRILFQRKLKKIFSTWIFELSKTMTKRGTKRNLAKKKAEDFVLKIQGALMISRVLQDNEVFVRTVNEAIDELLGE